MTAKSSFYICKQHMSCVFVPYVCMQCLLLLVYLYSWSDNYNSFLQTETGISQHVIYVHEK